MVRKRYLSVWINRYTGLLCLNGRMSMDHTCFASFFFFPSPSRTLFDTKMFCSVLGKYHLLKSLQTVYTKLGSVSKKIQSMIIIQLLRIHQSAPGGGCVPKYGLGNTVPCS